MARRERQKNFTEKLFELRWENCSFAGGCVGGHDGKRKSICGIEYLPALQPGCRVFCQFMQLDSCPRKQARNGKKPVIGQTFESEISVLQDPASMRRKRGEKCLRLRRRRLQTTHTYCAQKYSFPCAPRTCQKRKIRIVIIFRVPPPPFLFRSTRPDFSERLTHIRTT